MLRSCRNCREARRGCDKSKPFCRTCRKNGFVCQGYTQDKSRVFVNLGVGGSQKCDRAALINAVRLAKSSPYDFNHTVLTGDVLAGLGVDLWCTSIHCLDLTESDFRDHVCTLWNHFDIKHSLTNDAWVPSFDSLVGQNRYLDLALIALSALRFSQATRNARLRVMSLTAYGKSLLMLRRCVEESKLVEPADIATFATASMVFALYEAMHCTPDTIFDNGALINSAHMRGAKIFAQKCGPQGFQTIGLHLVFRKIREMIILDNYCNYHASFLADPEWITGPWVDWPKTFRDSLYDIAAHMTKLAAGVLHPDLGYGKEESSSLDLERLQHMLITIGSELDDWDRRWTKSLASQSMTFLEGLKGSLESLDCTTKDTSLADTLFLHLELSTLRLIWILCFIAMAAHTPFSPHTFQSSTLPSHIAAAQTAKALAEHIKSLLSISVFRLKGKVDQGITEGQCRSLLPAWSLREYNRTMSRGCGLQWFINDKSIGLHI